MRPLRALLLLFALGAHGAGAAEPALQAEAILKSVGREVGLAYFPRCGDGGLALALLAANPGVRVFGQDADYANVQTARKNADEKGWFGRRAWFDHGNLDRLLPAANSCDLVALDGLTEADLTPALAAEIARVLHPWFGVALLSGKVPGKLIEQWAKSFQGLGLRCEWLREKPGAAGAPAAYFAGPLLRVDKPALPGADNWGHFWHGPDNNAVSGDTAFHLPETMQWVGKPYFSGRVELPIISGGRLFMLWNSGGLDTSPDGAPRLPSWQGELGFDNPLADNRASDGSRLEKTREGPLLTCCGVGSGVWFWARRLSPAAWLQTARSSMVVDGESLLVADGGTILELDQATGGTIRQYDSGSEEVRWLAVADNRVFVLGGPKTRELKWRSVELISAYRSDGLMLSCLDRKTRKELWRVTRAVGDQAFDPRSPAVANGRIFTCTQAGLAEAHDIENGAPLWKTQIDNAENDLGPYAWDHINRHPVVGYALEGLYIIARSDRKSSVVLSQADGKEAWKIALKGRQRAPMPLSLNGKIWMGSDAFDPRTGALECTVGALDRGGCARVTASPQGLFGTCGMAFDLVNHAATGALPAKSSCGAGSFVANGLAWKFPTPCSGWTEWRGFMIRSGAIPAPNPPPRVWAGPVSTPQGDAAGWTTHRGAPDRAAASPASVGRSPKVLWETAPVHPPGPLSAERILLLDPELVSAPPVIAADRVIHATGDGAVEALALGTGKRLWRAFTGGRIYSSPTVWKDRVFAGSADGYLYAFALADGHELWRTRIAPKAARIPLYGQMGSRWPVLSSPLMVNEQAIIVSAGLAEGIDGVWVAAVAPASGELLWTQNNWQGTGTEGILSGAGQFMFNGKDVLYHGGESPLLRFDPANGTVAPALVLPDEAEARKSGVSMRSVEGIYRCAKGQDIGALDSQWTVFGGRRLFIDQSEPGTWRNSLSFHHSGAARGLPVIQISDSVLMPAWNGSGAVFVVDARKKQEAAFIPRADLLSLLEKTIAGTPAQPAAKASSHQVIRTISLAGNASVLWRRPLPEQERVRALALAADCALLAVEGKGKGRLIACDLKTGEDVWTLPLPSNAVYDGLAIAADGTLVVTLRDGGMVGVK